MKKKIWAMLLALSLMATCAIAPGGGAAAEEIPVEADWNNPYATIVSQGSGDPERGTVLTEDMLGQVLRVENQVGGWFRFTAPRDGDYDFSVLTPMLKGDSFTMRISRNGQPGTALGFERSAQVQTRRLEGVHQGDVIAWWDDDDTGRGYTMLDLYWLVITCRERPVDSAEVSPAQPQQEAQAQDGSWRTQRLDLNGAEFSLVLPEGYFLLNPLTREMVCRDPQTVEMMNRRHGEDWLNWTGDYVVNAITGDIAGYFLYTPSSVPMYTQSDLYLMQEQLAQAATQQLEELRHSNIECGLRQFGSGTIPFAENNLFFYAFAKEGLFGTGGHFITVGYKGTVVEFLTTDMEWEEIESILGSFSFPTYE